MQNEIRVYRSDDMERVVQFSLRAWAPVSASMERELGSEVFRLLYPDWASDQEREIRTTLTNPSTTVWVATSDGEPIGFVAAGAVEPDGVVGVIEMLAVDPDRHGQGIGTELTRTATAWLARSGARVAAVETGGDPGHAAARRTYEKAGYGLMPIARYFQALTGER